MVEEERLWLTLEDLEVTTGSIVSAPGGALAVRDGKVRAVSRLPSGEDARLIFRYLGPSDDREALASGELRRQIGVKLRASDSCNVVYVMWELAPLPAIRISQKLNPGLTLHTECGVEGYLPVDAPIPTKKIAPGEEHELRVRLEGLRLGIWADGEQVFDGRLAFQVRNLHGPVGLRTDNGSFDFHLGVTPPDQER